MDETPILPAHIEDTVQAIARLHADHQQEAGALQRLVERLTAGIGRPRFLALLTVAVVLWVGARAVQRFRMTVSESRFLTPARLAR